MLGRLIWGHSCNHSILIEEICFLSTWRQPTHRPWSRFRELMQMTPKKGCLKMHFTKRNKAFNFGQESSLVRVVMKSIADVLDKLCLLFILQGLCLFSVLKAPYFFPGLLKFQLFYAKLSLLLACRNSDLWNNCYRKFKDKRDDDDILRRMVKQFIFCF